MPKEMRKALSLEIKLQILDRLKNSGPASVGRFFNLNESSVRTIKKNEQKIRAAVKAGRNVCLTKTSHARDPDMLKMEECLMIWVEEKSQKNMPLNGTDIRKKARRLLAHIKATQPSSSETPTEFIASKGWFENFKKRFSLHHVKLQGENPSADEASAKAFSAEVRRIIDTEKYVADQIFNADETEFFWKKMPNRTYIAQEENSRLQAKDRVSLLLCSNASGNFVTKPMLIHGSSNPQSVKGMDKLKLPIYWRVNQEPWITAALFRDWFLNLFAPEVEAYMKKQNLAFKVLLILDKAPSHPTDISHPNIKVMFMPANTTSFIQPLEQGIFSTFKAIYIRKTFEFILAKLNSSSELTASDAWKNYTMANCASFIGTTIKELKASQLSGCWKKLCPDIVPDHFFVQDTDTEIHKIIVIAHLVGGDGFNDMNPNDILQLLTPEKELSEEDLVQMITKNDSESSDNEPEPTYVQDFTATNLNEGLRIAQKLEEFFIKNDPDVSRSLKFQRRLKQVLAPYYEIRKEIDRVQKQSGIPEFVACEAIPKSDSSCESSAWPPKQPFLVTNFLDSSVIVKTEENSD